MIIKLTLATLVLVLVAVIVVSYYMNKEGFEDITNTYYNSLSKNLGSAMNTVPPVTISDSDSSQVTKETVPVTSEKPLLMTSPEATVDTSSTPQRNDIVPQVTISGSGYDAMSAQQKADLLRDIQKAIRNELLVNRNTTPVVADTKNKTETDSTAQGKEYESGCYKDSEYRCPKNPDGTCPPVPDMSQYIKKDAIPCYGCVLDY
jgi:hypothetical protein